MILLVLGWLRMSLERHSCSTQGIPGDNGGSSWTGWAHPSGGWGQMELISQPCSHQANDQTNISKNRAPRCRLVGQDGLRGPWGPSVVLWVFVVLRNSINSNNMRNSKVFLCAFIFLGEEKQSFEEYWKNQTWAKILPKGAKDKGLFYGMASLSLPQSASCESSVPGGQKDPSPKFLVHTRIRGEGIWFCLPQNKL